MSMQVSGDGLLGAATGLVGGIIGSIGAGHRQRVAHRQQLELLQKQQDFAREVNQTEMDFAREQAQFNREWNDPAAQKARMEAAGYNPYLNGLDTQMVAGGASLGTGSSSLMDTTENTLAPLAQGLGGAAQGAADVMSSFQNVRNMREQQRSIQLANQAQDMANMIQASRVNYKDKNGKSLLDYKNEQEVSESLIAANQANVSAAMAAFESLKLDWANKPAVDADGKPVLDSSGQPLTNLNQQEQLKLNEMAQNVMLMVSQGQKVDAEKELARFDLMHLKPAQLQQIRATIQEIQTQCVANLAQAGAANASAGLMGAQTLTENGLRIHRKAEMSWRKEESKTNALTNWSRLGAVRSGARLEEDFNNSSLGPWAYGLGRFTGVVQTANDVWGTSIQQQRVNIDKKPKPKPKFNYKVYIR